MPTIRDVLRDPAAFGLEHALFATKPVTSPDADCLVLDPNDVEDDDDEEPVAARDAGYQYVLMINDVYGVISNLRQQGAELTDDLRFEAFRFYLARDAHIAL